MKKKYNPVVALKEFDEPKDRVIDFGDDVGKMTFKATDAQTLEIIERLSPLRLGLALIRR